MRRTRLLEAPADCDTASSTRSLSSDCASASSSTLPHSQHARSEKHDEPALVGGPSPSPLRSRVATPPARSPDSVHAFQDSGALENPPSRHSHVSDEPFLANRISHTYEDEESDGRKKRRKVIATTMPSLLDTKALACPFYKHNPRRYNPRNENMSSAMRYRTCVGPGWETISRLRYPFCLVRGLRC